MNPFRAFFFRLFVWLAIRSAGPVNFGSRICVGYDKWFHDDGELMREVAYLQRLNPATGQWERMGRFFDATWARMWWTDYIHQLWRAGLDTKTGDIPGSARERHMARKEDA